QARHPADRRAITDHGAHAGRLQELLGEALAPHAAEHAAGGEIHEVAIAARAVAGERLAELLAGDAAQYRRDRRRPAVEGEVIDRRIEELLLAPHHATGPA